MIVALSLCLVLALAFEVSNGFHDSANAVATVIYTNSLKPFHAILWSGLMNFLGVMLGGTALAFALVDLLPVHLLSNSDGHAIIALLLAVFTAALTWNLATWWLGLPNSSSHAIIGALVGAAVADAIAQHRSLSHGVNWSQVGTALQALLLSPLLGFVLAGLLFLGLRGLVHEPSLYQAPTGRTPPVWWLRLILLATCTGVSFAHGTNDGQKSLGLIMLVIISLWPTAYGINHQVPSNQVRELAEALEGTNALVAQDGGNPDRLGPSATPTVIHRLRTAKSLAALPVDEKSALHHQITQLLPELQRIVKARSSSEAAQTQAINRYRQLRGVEYVPGWVRLVSALGLGLGTLFGYRRIVRSLGTRIGRQRLVPAQGGSAETVAALLIGTAGVTGLIVSTTHVVTSGIAGTMIAAGAGLEGGFVWRIVASWLLTLPATLLLSGVLFLLLT